MLIQSKRSISATKGFSLIEILVTVAITTVGLVGLVALLLESDRSAQDSTSRSLAAWMIDDLTNRIMANQDAVASYDTGAAAVSCAARPTMCAYYHDGTSRKASANCSGAQMAAFDLWDVACPSDVSVTDSDITRAGNADFLAPPSLVVDVQAGLGVGASSTQVQITITWDVRTSGTLDDGSTNYLNEGDITNRTDSLSTEIDL
ncbi:MULTISPECIES: prepilin-type N-terminal cleavage/methylation domain-containing protein [unclassified Oceanobacter]|jgi:type IV pilus assembly protein PilV|uniref:type IV pilus modification PilV family protein n=1 Tax=unclassified Oceanobacter TaxID=2620260 RepID=UPI0026E26CA9|nr:MULTISPECIES: prepilin-type N-terminal cleavage/methylation domain-containing protein [unclassified Oceanobacter]MDO6681256.1 prepilin-type N-terminal cleavage/methylation domain-containing protein [Oceanobacter sp. 5_MG-2023]MDP2505225.1 prepilin-type N-terminal cleavage/methylation domain-containing protein [Oceanobacter sp. 3_MG-2023]MDP2549210.1 prepilin-type N-terminal cleavage/methylation domain-containing protein [Oceanobacter sp. 4_MG-2023]MDP2608001.1 prepilin-type N-terminal cleava